MVRLAWLVLCVTLVAGSRPRYAKKDVEEDFELLSKDLKEYEKILEEAKSASHSAQEAAQKFAKNNPKDFEEYEKNVREAATAAATALEKAHAHLKKEATEIPKKALHGAEAA